MVIAVYLLAFALPLFLLYAIHSRPWYLHALAVVAALAIGFVSPPEEWKGITFDLAFGGTITFLLVWGIGGLLTVHRHHREKHA
jgi:peptidoglycan/LPS O-acetylase OafA/YrhL